jgi:putative ABC transport system substrate-binding protein
VAARAQQGAMPVVGFLGSASAGPIGHFLAAFHQGLGESGYVEGRNIVIEYRWADNRYDRLPEMAAELVRRQVAVIVASGGPVPAVMAKAATSTIPIVFTATSDPVRLGLVSSLNRPGGNVTGSAMFTAELEPKRLELLRELVPKARLIGALVNPDRTDGEVQSRAVQDAAQALGLSAIVLRANSERDLEPALAALVQSQGSALVVGADPFFQNRRAQIVSLAARHALPAIYMSRDFVAAGGLASYGTSIADGYRQAGIYVGQILKGAKPADLPVIQPTKFDLAINLRTATALGLTVPPSLLARADEVIEQER